VIGPSHRPLPDNTQLTTDITHKTQHSQHTTLTTNKSHNTQHSQHTTLTTDITRNTQHSQHNTHNTTLTTPNTHSRHHSQHTTLTTHNTHNTSLTTHNTHNTQHSQQTALTTLTTNNTHNTQHSQHTTVTTHNTHNKQHSQNTILATDITHNTQHSQHTTLTTHRYPCPRWDSNPQSHQAFGHRPTPQTARPPDRRTVVCPKELKSTKNALGVTRRNVLRCQTWQFHGTAFFSVCSQLRHPLLPVLLPGVSVWYTVYFRREAVRIKCCHLLRYICSLEE